MHILTNLSESKLDGAHSERLPNGQKIIVTPLMPVSLNGAIFPENCHYLQAHFREFPFCVGNNPIEFVESLVI